MSAWQPIETAPKDGTAIAVYLPWIKAVRTAHYERKRKWIVHFCKSDARAMDYAPSHWMPLPEPPKVAQ